MRTFYLFSTSKVRQLFTSRCLPVSLMLFLSFALQAQDIEWDKTFGGHNWDRLSHIEQTSDGGYVLGGTSSSGISGDKNEPSRGVLDYWIVKLNGKESCTPPAPVITLVPSSDVNTGGDASTIYWATALKACSWWQAAASALSGVFLSA